MECPQHAMLGVSIGLFEGFRVEALNFLRCIGG